MADQSTTPSTDTASGSILDDYVLKQVSIRAAIVVGHSCLPEDLTNDVSQDMIVELLKAQRRFDPARASKHTFASRVLDRFCQHFVRSQATRQRNGWSETRCTDMGVDFTMDNRAVGDGLPDEFVREEDRETIRLVLAKLPQDLRQLCQILLGNRDRVAAAEALGVGRSTIYRRIEKLREFFSAAGVEIFDRNCGTHHDSPQK